MDERYSLFLEKATGGSKFIQVGGEAQGLDDSSFEKSEQCMTGRQVHLL